MPETAGDAITVESVTPQLPTLLVLASTYPRWEGDPEPGFVHELSKRLTDRFRVVVLGPHAPGALPRETMEGVEVIRYRYAPQRWETLVNDGGIVTNLRRSAWKSLLVPGFVLAQAWQAWRIIRKHDVQVVHAHWLIPQGLICALLNLLPGRKVPFLVTSHGADLFALKGALMKALKRFVIRRASAMTVVSMSMKDELTRLDMDTARVHVQSMGVDLQGRFHPDPQVKRSRDELLFVGRLVEKKGLRYLLASLPAVFERYPHAFLTIAGFGPGEIALREQAKALGIVAKVNFVGATPQSELPEYYRRAALFVAPFVQASDGDQEGLGLVVLEALGCGCPVIAGDVPAVRDLPVTRIRVDADGELARAVIRVLDEPGRAKEEAINQRSECLVRFDWTGVAHHYAEQLSLLLPDGRNVAGDS